MLVDKGRKKFEKVNSRKFFFAQTATSLDDTCRYYKAESLANTDPAKQVAEAKQISPRWSK
ncbi:MAG: hypothetical protein K8R02_04390 [Anaerohalosphaeraceae bacterium]|nr:hypothetical protein [Anaerohalosphaeraceae bacterium]